MMLSVEPVGLDQPDELRRTVQTRIDLGNSERGYDACCRGAREREPQCHGNTDQCGKS
jgi:hypothetical protein